MYVSFCSHLMLHPGPWNNLYFSNMFRIAIGTKNRKCLLYLSICLLSLVTVLIPFSVSYGEPIKDAVIRGINFAPGDLEYDPIHETVSVLSERMGTLTLIDTNNNAVIDSIVVGSNPRGIAYDSKHMRMYVTNFGSNSVSAIDTNTNTVIGNPIAVGDGPHGIAYDPRHMRMYVTNSDNDTVSIIDTNNNAVIDSIVVGSNPRGIAYDSKHMRMYVTNFGSNSVSAIDTNTNTVIGNPIAVGDGPRGIAYDTKHMKMYVTNFGSNSVSVIDTNTNTGVSEGIKIYSPMGVTYDILNSKLYVTSIGEDAVVMIDSRSNAIVGNPVPSGGNPIGLGLDYKNGRVFASNHANASLTVIKITSLRTLITSAVDERNEPISYGGHTSSSTITFDFYASSAKQTSGTSISMQDRYLSILEVF